MKRQNTWEMPGAPPPPCLGEEPCREPDLTLALTLHQFAESLGNAVDAKDHCTSAHSAEVAAVSQELALRMGFTPEAADLIPLAGHLHDIGKIGLPDRILSKPGPLTPEEWRRVRRHPVIGAEIVRPVKALGRAGRAGGDDPAPPRALCRRGHPPWARAPSPRPPGRSGGWGNAKAAAADASPAAGVEAGEKPLPKPSAAPKMCDYMVTGPSGPGPVFLGRE